MKRIVYRAQWAILQSPWMDSKDAAISDIAGNPDFYTRDGNIDDIWVETKEIS